jgi:hypothetical protein
LPRRQSFGYRSPGDVPAASRPPLRERLFFRRRAPHARTSYSRTQSPDGGAFRVVIVRARLLNLWRRTMSFIINPEDLVVESFALSEGGMPVLEPVQPGSDEESRGLPKCCTGEASGCDT